MMLFDKDFDFTYYFPPFNNVSKALKLKKNHQNIHEKCGTAEYGAKCVLAVGSPLFSSLSSKITQFLLV